MAVKMILIDTVITVRTYIWLF